MELTRNFTSLNKDDATIAGGKGASLGEMTQVGIPVPSGFVILSTTFDQFIQDADLIQEIDAIIDGVNHEDINTVEVASEKIQALIKNAEMPENIAKEIKEQFKKLDAEFVAVRSSATAEDGAENAWAGQLDSYLNTKEDKLLEKVQDCWASLFTPRAIFYRFEKGLHTTKISVAVVVQKMVNSEISGIAFSVHPVTEDRNQLIIEAGFGLGEAIVSGQITPDSYVVEKEPMRILDKNISEQTRELQRKESGGNDWVMVPYSKQNTQVLSDDQIFEFSKIILTIENHYGFPCDIEWAYEAGKFYIVQSRPITTLTDKTEITKQFKRDDYILSFWVQGVSVFVTDIHLDAYKILQVLYIIDNGMFKQYFTKKAYGEALDRGLEFYSDKDAFDNYKKDLSSHCDKFTEFFESEIKNQKLLSREKVIEFFEYTKKLCRDYAQMNLESTDKAFAQQENNLIIQKNLSEVAKFKDTVRGIMNMVLFEPNGYSHQFFVILGNQFNLPPSIFDNLTQKETLDLFEDKKPDESVVSSRQKAFVESYNLESFYEGKEAELILQEFRENIEYTDTFHGQTASKGKITGMVKIIPVDYSNPDRINIEIEKMKQGDILVAETTAPELIVACKKAGAIITDMGGLMSHAAIVSREFGIPCIVGARNASKILKDGDMVEIDANNGVVRIIK